MGDPFNINETESDVSFLSEDEDRLGDLYMAESEKFDNLGEISEKLFNLGVDIEISETQEKVLFLLERERKHYQGLAEEYLYPEPDYEGASSSGSMININSLFSDL